MATLTWRNVDSPNFAGAMAGYRSSAELLNNAFDSLRQGLGDFQAQRTADADSQVLANSLQFTDPAAYQEALKSGAILGGIDPTRVSSQALGALASRAGTLINNSTNQYTLDRTQQVDAASDAARPALVALAEASASGDPARIAAVQKEFAPQLAGLPAEEILRSFSTAQGMETGAIRNEGSRFTNATAQRDDADTQAATALVNSIRENNITVEGARQELLDANLSAGARNKATQALGAMFPGMFGPLGSTPAPGGGSGGFTAGIPFAETRNYVGSILGKAGEVTGTNEEKAEKLLPFLINQESGGNNNAVSPKGARGLTQVMPKTGEDPGYGVAPLKDQSPEEYRRFGKDYLVAMLNKYDGDVEKSLAAYNAGPGNVDDWVAASANEVAAAQGQLGQRTMSNNAADGAAQDLVKNFGSNATVGSVTDQLVKGDFAGADSNKVRNQIRKIMEMSASKEYGGTGSPSINAAQAGAILQRSIATSDPLAADGNTGFTSSWFADEVGVNDDDVAAAVRNFNSGGSLDAALENQQVAQVSQMLTQAQQASQSAMNELVQAARRAQSQPGARDELPQFIQRAQQSSQRVQQLLDMQRRSPQFQANRAAAPNEVLPTEEDLQAFQTWGRY